MRDGHGSARDGIDGPARVSAKRFDRRRLLRAGGIGAGAVALGVGFGRRGVARDATGNVVTSVAREEYAQALLRAYPMTEGVAGGKLVCGASSDLATVNGILAGDSLTAAITGLIYEPLVDVSVIDGSIVPRLAERYEIAADGMTYTFGIDPHATWHDGSPVTAADVKFSMDVILHLDTASPYARQMQAQTASYRVVDDKTFEVVATFPSALFLYKVALPLVVMPRHLWETVPPAEWWTDPGSTGADPSRVVGTGPFTFVEWIPGDRVRLVRNENYYDTVTSRVPYLDEFVLRILPDLSTAVQDLISGGIDLIETVPAEQTEDVLNTAGRHVQTYDTFDFTFYMPNLNPERTPFFQDVKVRQALLTAINRQQVVDTIYAGFGERALGTHPRLSPAYAPEAYDETWQYDPDRANRMLEEAGWVDGDGDGIREKDGQAFSFTLKVPDGSMTSTLLAAYFQEAWATVGAECRPELMPLPALLEQTDARDFDMLLLGFSGSPDGDHGSMFSCSAQEGGFNYAGYCNEEYDVLQEQQLRELDPVARRRLLIQQSQIVWRDQPVGIVRFAVGRTGVNTHRVRNYHANGYGFTWSLPWTYVDEG